MTRTTDDGFTGRVVMAIASAMARKDYKDAERNLLVIAKEHGVGASAAKVMGR